MKESTPMNLLTEAQIKKINDTALALLSNTGIHLPHPAARQLLLKRGAKEDADGRVLIPPAMVEDALAIAPAQVPWYDQTGKREFTLAKNRTYFGPGSDSLYIVDRGTGKVRRAVLQDVIDNVRVVEALPQLDFVMSMGLPIDVEPAKTYPSVFREMMIHSTKPIIITSTCLADIEIPYEMAKLVAGGEKKLREKPFFITYIEPESPLKFESDIVDRIWFCGEHGIPTMGVTAPNLGGGGPVTMEGALAQGTAESLAALVILQLRYPGAGFVFGANSWATDMRSAIVCYGSPEVGTSTAAYAAMARFYGLPAWGGAGCTDAQYLDAQAGEEAAQSILLALQGGTTIAHDVGFLAYGSLYDARFLILNDEMIARTRHILRPFELTEEGLAQSVIDTVARASIKGKGPTIYLKHPHTAKNFKQALYMPPLYIERGTLKPESPGKPLLEKLGKQVEKILSPEAEPTLPEAVVNRLYPF